MPVGEQIEVGVVGAGARSRLALNALDSSVPARIAAVADTTEEGRARAAQIFGPEASVVPDVGSLIAQGIDAAFVTTPDFTHAAIASQLLRAGVAVYLEKPLAITVEGADEVLRAAYESGSRLYVGHNMRHMPVVRLMRRLIQSGEIGEVKAVWCRHFVGNGGDYYFKDWHAERAKTTGLLLQKGAHDIDVIHWLADGYSVDVTGMGDLTVYGAIQDRADNTGHVMQDWFSYDNWPPASQTGLNPVIDVEDISMVSLRLDNGVLASYEQCHFTPDYWRNYTVIGTEGRLENFGDSAGGTVRVWNRRTSYNESGDESYPIPEGEGGHNGADALTVAEFLRFVSDGGATDTSPVAARNAVAAGVAATESLRNGSMPRRVPPLAPELLDYFAHHQQRRGVA
ncbi:Gfo/Idh/MocA family protein [Rathayibacter sp. KR2-224]|uniref:Gfo/Idh/MocA family protein n=1 Tax=Rathayibacter sp. KR2-224 TaxID=3400913 RepID=UPI003C08F6E6